MQGESTQTPRQRENKYWDTPLVNTERSGTHSRQRPPYNTSAGARADCPDQPASKGHLQDPWSGSLWCAEVCRDKNLVGKNGCLGGKPASSYCRNPGLCGPL